MMILQRLSPPVAKTRSAPTNKQNEPWASTSAGCASDDQTEFANSSVGFGQRCQQMKRIDPVQVGSSNLPSEIPFAGQ